MKRPFTPSDISTLRRLVASGMTDGQIAERMGRDRDVVGCKRRALDIRPGVSAAAVAMMARIKARRNALTFRYRSYA